MRKYFVFYILSVFLILAIFIQISYMAVAKAEQPIISIPDPAEDDKGPGYYGYPTNAVFGSGAFDIIKLEIYVTDTSVVFKTYFRNLSGNPWNGPNGFSLQYVQIYVRTTQRGLPARADTAGLGVYLRPDYSWHFALLISPGWGDSPLPAGEKPALVYANGTIVMQNDVFKIYADATNNAIVAEVSKSLLYDVDNIAKWSIIVFATSWAGENPDRIRSLSVNQGEWVLWAATDPAYLTRIAKAITFNIAPKAMDMAIYSSEYPNGITADEQYRILDSYDPDKGIPAMVPALPSVALTTTVTQTIFSTIAKTETQLMTQTQILTYTSTITTTQTSTISTTDYTTTIILGIALLVIGIVIGYFIRR
ncbi:Protein of unknown function DUF2223 [Ignisphaera aggregans DSM 17230]|uniref:Glucodextranase-like C-terminal domain-containing protein n=1 Tax=Ignisphaera aggregans (strain DSM 17230 / JCM 13409 / AQ1.S1) TaxID=583356 RepID=E0SSW6_IGNAA|nr:Protein of unknown function DUF2223 [Ignisphaera aggregans DSM 17230]